MDLNGAFEFDNAFNLFISFILQRKNLLLSEVILITAYLCEGMLL